MWYDFFIVTPQKQPGPSQWTTDHQKDQRYRLMKKTHSALAKTSPAEFRPLSAICWKKISPNQICDGEWTNVTAPIVCINPMNPVDGYFGLRLKALSCNIDNKAIFLGHNSSNFPWCETISVCSLDNLLQGVLGEEPDRRIQLPVSSLPILSKNTCSTSQVSSAPM